MHVCISKNMFIWKKRLISYCSVRKNSELKIMNSSHERYCDGMCHVHYSTWFCSLFSLIFSVIQMHNHESKTVVTHLIYDYLELSICKIKFPNHTMSYYGKRDFNYIIQKCSGIKLDSVHTKSSSILNHFCTI